MMVDDEAVQKSLRACLRNAKELVDAAEWSLRGQPSGLALAMLSQEECAKAFVFALVRDGILPWTAEVRRSLSYHECKNLITIVMEWLSAVNEMRFQETSLREGPSESVQHLPADVAIALNIYRHELIERVPGRGTERYPEWDGVARKVAGGKRDRKKQAALYVGIGEDGGVASEPASTVPEYETELTLAKKLMEFAEDVDRKCIFAYEEYELFANIFRSLISESPEPDEQLPFVTEEFPEGIPGVVLVKRMITVAEVVRYARTEEETDCGIS